MPFFFFFCCSLKVTLVLLGDHNFEIRIGSKDWVSQAQASGGAESRACARCICPSPHLGQVTLSAKAPNCGLSPLLPCTCTCVHLFFSSLFGEWWQVTVAAVYGWWLWMCAGPVLWIILSVAGVTAAPREFGTMGQHPCAHTHLFVFSPPLVGVELGSVCVAAGGPCWSSPLLGLPPGMWFCEGLSSQFKAGADQGA
jgi:hypothetical protein